MSKYLCPTSNVCRVHVSIGFVSVCVCWHMHVEENFFVQVLWVGMGGVRSRGPRSAVCRLPSLSCGWVGVCGHVGPVCGNPALLTSHTLFSRSYKPLMPQKMLSLLWPGTAEGGGRPMERRQAREERSSQTLAWYRCFGYRPTFSLLPSTLLPSSTILSASMLSPLLFSLLFAPLCSPLLFSSFLFSLHSSLPLRPSWEDLAGPDLEGGGAYHTKELNQLKVQAFSSSLQWLIWESVKEGLGDVIFSLD